jgi:hypothetical protein
MRRFFILCTMAFVFAFTGCHSPYISATVSNRTAQRIDLLEVDYPSASFGTQNLKPGEDFHYRFKVLGSGSMKLLYTDDGHQDHKSDGPLLKEGAEGLLTIAITPTGVDWQTSPGVAAKR